MITAFFDGACEPMNPGGNMGIGAIIYGTEKEGILLEHHRGVPAGPGNTNNVSEYLALIAILDFLLEQGLHERRISIKGDSMLVVNQMKGLWRMKQGAYLKHAKDAKLKMAKFKCLSINWVPREQNDVADVLSKMGLQSV